MKKSLRTMVGLLALVAVVGCNTAKKKDGADGSEVSTATDKNIVNKEMNFDIQGSDSGKIDGLNTVNFDYDQSSLSADAKKKLGANAKWIKGNKSGVQVQIEGHCDERGSVEYNLALGERRAKAAKAYLVSLGVESKRLSIISYGKEKPLDRGDSESSMARNRRANFVPLPQ